MKTPINKPVILLDLEPLDELFSGILEACDSMGWRVVNLAYTSQFIPEGLDYVGAIIDSHAKPETIEGCELRGIPIVRKILFTESESDDEYIVDYDHYLAGVMAADFFYDRGFREFCFIVFETELAVNIHLRGFEERFNELTDGKLHLILLENIHDVSGRDRFEFYVDFVAEQLKTLPTPLAIYANNARMSARVIYACLKTEIAIPEQVAILCGVDYPLFCKTAFIPLTAIDTNLRECGRQMVSLLEKINQGHETEKIILVPPAGIVERRSTDVQAVPDQRVAIALRYIWDHLEWSLNVDDIAAHVNVSRSTLERAFKRHLGRGVNAEIRRKRLEECQKFLLKTDLTVEMIAEKTGFSNKRYLHKAFKKAFQMTPRQYRLSKGDPRNA